jgi:hypothetical protein
VMNAEVTDNEVRFTLFFRLPLEAVAEPQSPASCHFERSDEYSRFDKF